MTDEVFHPDAVILANGEYPTNAYPLQILNDASYVVCCDGAANEYLSRGNIPDVIIGDGDSILPKYKEQYASILHHVADQETNDQTKAVLYLKENGYHNIAIVGATGKREDHTLGNISLLKDYMEMGLNVCMITDYGVFRAIENTQTFQVNPGQQLSIINFNAKGLRGEGLVYPLSDFTNWWQGTLNEANAGEVTIHCIGEYILFIAYLEND